MGFFANMIGQKAMVAHGKAEYDKAIKLYEEAYAKGMNQPRLLRGYSVLLIRTSQFDKALEVLKKMEKLPLQPKEKDDLYVNYAIILWQKGHLDRAMQVLDDIFRHNKSGMIYSIIGYLKIEQGNAEEALAFNQEALDYDDQDPVFLDNLAQTYYRLLGDKETAKPYFEKALTLKPAAIDTNYFLAHYAIDEGDYDTARKHLETAKEGFFSPLNYATPQKIDEKLAEIKDK
ncbi:MAG: tetratricopeptide repeat protein [Clostridia bacterium]|nr:tetratricopeptide repeat protein [Clostridia bacterium]